MTIEDVGVRDSAYYSITDLEWPDALLSDSELRLAETLGLPTFEVAGMTLYRRLTFIAQAGHIQKVFYPVFPPERNASDVLAWLSQPESAENA